MKKFTSILLLCLLLAINSKLEAQGCPNRSLNFNGSSAYMRISNNTALNLSGGITLEAWIYPTAYGTNGSYIMSRGGGSCEPEGRYSMRLNSSGNLEFTYSESSSYSAVLQSVLTVPLNTWSHVAVTYNYANHSGSLYLNGQPFFGNWMSNPVTYTYNFTTVSDLTIGAKASTASTCNSSPPSAYSNFFQGQIDEVRVFNTDVGSQTIADFYNKSISPVHYYYANLLLNYRFDDGTSSPVNNGSLSAFSILLGGTTIAQNGAPLNVLSTSCNGFAMQGYATANDVITFDAQTQLSISAWIYPIALPSNGKISTIVGKGSAVGTASDGFGLTLSTNGVGTTVLVAAVGNGTSLSSATTTVSNAILNKWMYVTLTWSSGGAVKLHVNGNLAATGPTLSGSTFNNTSKFSICSSQASTEQGFAGYVDEVSLFNINLDGTGAITTQMNQAIGSWHPFYNYLLGYWQFDGYERYIPDLGCGKNSLDMPYNALGQSFAPCMVPTTLPPAQNLIASTNDLEKITLTWDNPAGFTGGVNPVPQLDGSVAYDIYRDGQYLSTQYSSAGQNTYVDNNASCIHSYSVRAFWRQYSTSNIILYSTDATATGRIADINFHASHGAYLNKTTLTWNSQSTIATGGFEIKRDGQQIALLTSPSVTSYNDFDGTPGLRYTYEIKPLASGHNYKVCPDSGWIKENGRLSGYVKSPLQAPVPGVIVTATGTVNGNNYTYSDTTDASGFYEIREVFYNTQATYTLTPSKGTHHFNPASLQRTLDVLAYNAPQANFTDTSVFTVSGTVYFPNQLNQPGCGVKGVKILVNGADQSITTDVNGNWSYTISQEANYTFTPVYKNHQFNTPSQTFFVNDDLSNVNFIDTTTDVLHLSLTGYCNTQVCDNSTIHVAGTSAGGCYDQTFTVPGNGELVVTLPAQEYLVTLSTVTDALDANNAFQVKNNALPYSHIVDLSERDTTTTTAVSIIEPIITGGDTVTLPNGQISVTPLDTVYTYDTVTTVSTPEREARFLYGGRLEIVALGIDTLQPCGKVLMQQGNLYQSRFDVFRKYTYQGFSSYCRLDTGLLQIYDDVSDSGFVNYAVDSGKVKYTINPGKPNISGSGPHPYEKFIMLTASGIGATNASLTIWATVLGNRSLTPTFITKTPELPFFVLHDPPGDGSSATLTQGSSLSYGYEMGIEKAVGYNIYENINIGAEVPVPFTGIVFNAGGSLNISLTTNNTNTSNKSVNTTFTVQNSYSTSGADDFVGEDADIVVGASLNLIYGLSYILHYDTAGCGGDIDTALTWGANDFATTYAYTIGHIKNTLIPQFEFLRNYYQQQGSDSALIYQNYINVWNQVVDQNHNNIQNAEFKENRSFSAGVSYTNTTSYENSNSFSIQYQTSINPVLAASINVGTENNNVEVGTEVNLNWTTTTNKSNSVTNSKEVAYTLTDDDPGDFFSVDVKRDKVYGTPCFKLVAGTSSCPHEEGAQQRDVPEIQVINPLQQNVPVTSSAVFTVQMSNFSESNEDRTYEVIVDPNSNLDGAIVRLGGQLISQFPASFTIPANQSIFATLSVEKGPIAVDYNNLKLSIYSPCDPSISDDASFTVGFQGNCTPVTLYTPANNWLVNSDPQNQNLAVTYGGFNANDSSLAEIGLEIHVGNSWNVIPASKVSKLQLQQNNFPYYAVSLNMSGFADGNYDIRAYAICNTQPPIKSYSPPLSGVIDHTSIALFGTPSPSDGVLNVGEDISVTFNESLDCNHLFNLQNLVYDSVTLRRSDNGQLIPSSYACSGSKIIITTNPPSLIDSLQNVALTARVRNIYDMNGNLLNTPIEWSFVVNRSKQYWNPSSLSVSLEQNGMQNITAALKNDGLSTSTFTITNLPSWLSTPTFSGSVPAGNFVNINFTINATLNPGIYNDTVFANFGGGNKQYLFVRLEVRRSAPYWAVNPSQYQYSMNIISNFSLTGLNAPLSADVNDRIAVFAGNECRGVGNIAYVQVGNIWEAFITVYSNSTNGEALRFRMWDASTGTEYEATETANFVNNAVLGQQLAPMILHPAGLVQRIPVAAGWNWFSLHIAANDMSTNSMLRYLVADSAMIVKTDNSYAQFSPSTNSWQGSMSSFGYQKSYMIFMSHADTLQFVGNPLADTVTIPLAQGWNWMGYPQFNNHAINSYMSTFSAANGDVLKSQTQFATYSTNWSGSLTQLGPGKGYKLQTANGGVVLAAPDRSAPGWSVSEFNYEYNMNITAVLRVNNIDMYGGYLVGAFINGTCIGTGTVQTAGGLPRLFMTLHGNTAFNNQAIEFRVYEYPTDSNYVPTYTAINFTADGQAGSVENPFVLSFGSSWNNVASFDKDGYALYQNVPNPFNNQTGIRFVTPKEGKVSLQVFDYTGKLVQLITEANYQAGEHLVTFNTGELSAGIYFYRMVAGNFVQTKKMIIE